ncbi:uncharacterized protein ARMOST_06599 [Armillaria ostoyae]|uniref:Uncharacterized protein n=1 Tax=Armillaria ostoyae TaxID=47428 RepID=A0A284R3F3_ARMOS|nr:uncharacterized protein ARMOST_06599 [Armillaria ostoyae]
MTFRNESDPRSLHWQKSPWPKSTIATNPCTERQFRVYLILIKVTIWSGQYCISPRGQRRLNMQAAFLEGTVGATQPSGAILHQKRVEWNFIVLLGRSMQALISVTVLPHLSRGWNLDLTCIASSWSGIIRAVTISYTRAGDPGV